LLRLMQKRGRPSDHPLQPLPSDVRHPVRRVGLHEDQRMVGGEIVSSTVWGLRESMPNIGDKVTIDGQEGEVMLIGKAITGKSSLVTIRFKDGEDAKGFPIYRYEHPTLVEFLASLEVKP